MVLSCDGDNRITKPPRRSTTNAEAAPPNPLESIGAPQQVGGSPNHRAGTSLARLRAMIEGRRMRYFIAAGLALAACRPSQPEEHYGFITRLGRDTIAVERVTRQGNRVTSDEADRFPRVRQRHTQIELGPKGGIRRLVMTSRRRASRRISGTGASRKRDDRLVHITKQDSRARRRDFATGGIAMAHRPQMYSLYELYFDAALAS
jgi:hypothetical protein